MPWPTPGDVPGVTDVSGNDDLTAAVNGAIAFVKRERPDLATGQTGDDAWLVEADTFLGTAMLAGRLYERRGSLLGVAPSAGYEEAATILRNDPDIERLLQIGRSRPFGFGAA